MPEQHTLMGGKLHVYRRDRSSKWQCATFLHGRNWRKSTKQESLALAKDIAHDWYLTLFGKSLAGQLKNEENFAEAAKHFLREVQILIAHERNPRYHEGHEYRLRVHLVPFFGKMHLSAITETIAQEYRIHRSSAKTNPVTGEYIRPAPDTLKKEIITLRLVLKSAKRRGKLTHLPDLAAPFRSPTSVSYRAWFPHEEYKALYEATRKKTAQKHSPVQHWIWQQLHDHVLLVTNSGLRPDEAARLTFRDVSIIRDDATKQTILGISARGKRGAGYCKSMPGAVLPFKRLRERARPQERGDAPEAWKKPGLNDLVFPGKLARQFDTVLKELNLKHDPEGRPRTLYSLRHSYICFRLLEGANIYELAKNCRTSVQIIERHYAAHLKDMINASSINMRRPNLRKTVTSK